VTDKTTQLPTGRAQKFCSDCASPLISVVPSGDGMRRYVCPDCNVVHYENPKIVSGCVVGYQGSILLCRRAIEPRYNYWTVPAGFMELNETVADAATRETREEACTEIILGPLLAVVDVVHAGQVHMFFSGEMLDGNHKAGEESLDTKLFAAADIPWDEIAFPSGIIALQRYLNCLKTGETDVLYAQAERMNQG
jgi:ADP-ribose pyrophosphatase YjhB (NUDIX family)